MNKGYYLLNPNYQDYLKIVQSFLNFKTSFVEKIETKFPCLVEHNLGSLNFISFFEKINILIFNKQILNKNDFQFIANFFYDFLEEDGVKIYSFLLINIKESNLKNSYIVSHQCCYSQNFLEKKMDTKKRYSDIFNLYFRQKDNLNSQFGIVDKTSWLVCKQENGKMIKRNCKEFLNSYKSFKENLDKVIETKFKEWKIKNKINISSENLILNSDLFNRFLNYFLSYTLENHFSVNGIKKLVNDYFSNLKNKHDEKLKIQKMNAKKAKKFDNYTVVAKSTIQINTIKNSQRGLFKGIIPASLEKEMKISFYEHIQSLKAKRVKRSKIIDWIRNSDSIVNYLYKGFKKRLEVLGISITELKWFVTQKINPNMWQIHLNITWDQIRTLRESNKQPSSFNWNAYRKMYSIDNYRLTPLEYYKYKK